MSSTDIASAFTSIRETLDQGGIEDDFLLDLIASRLIVERVGESNNMGWWESRVLSETGRARLSEVTPKTQFKSRITLALKVGRKAESDRLPEDSISLFYFGPQIETRLSAAIDDLESEDNLTLEVLEDLSASSVEDGWTDAIIEGTSSNISVDDITNSRQTSPEDEVYLIGESGYTQTEVEPEKWRILTTLLREYGQCTDQLQIPYYTLEPEFKSDNA